MTKNEYIDQLLVLLNLGSTKELEARAFYDRQSTEMVHNMLEAERQRQQRTNKYKTSGGKS